MNIHIGMDARKLEDGTIPNLYEVVLSARAEAKIEIAQCAGNADRADIDAIAETRRQLFDFRQRTLHLFAKHFHIVFHHRCCQNIFVVEMNVQASLR